MCLCGNCRTGRTGPTVLAAPGGCAWAVSAAFYRIRGRYGCWRLFMRKHGRVWECMRVYESIAAHCSDIVCGRLSDGSDGSDGYCRQAVAIVCVAAKITRALFAWAVRLPAAAGFARFSYPLIHSHTLPYSPIIYRAAHPASLHYAAASRSSPCSSSMLAAELLSPGLGGCVKKAAAFFCNGFCFYLPYFFSFTLTSKKVLSMLPGTVTSMLFLPAAL